MKKSMLVALIVLVVIVFVLSVVPLRPLKKLLTHELLSQDAGSSLKDQEVPTTLPPAVASSDFLVGPVVFHWFRTKGNAKTVGQFMAPWLPIEGRGAWDGSVEFWKKQDEDIARSKSTFIFFEIPYQNAWGKEMDNHLTAIKERKDASLPVFKVAPYFADESWNWKRQDLSTEAGVDIFYAEIQRWFARFFASGLTKDDLAWVDGKVLMGLWIVNGAETSATTLFSDLNKRLERDFGFSGFWSANKVWEKIGPDELNKLFTPSGEIAPDNIANPSNVKITVGFWRPNAGPSYSFGKEWAPRFGGSVYRANWERLLAERGKYPDVKRIYIESWNEYEEGSGMYAAQDVRHSPGDGHPTVRDFDQCMDNPCHPVEYLSNGTAIVDWWGKPYTYIDITAEMIGRLTGT